MNDVRQAIRQLVIRPGLALAVTGMLAVGIGATTGIFSLFYQVLLEPLPVPEAEQLVELRVEGTRQIGGRVGMAYVNVNALFSYPMLRELETEQQAFTTIAGHTDFIANVTADEQTIVGTGAMVSGGYFQTLNLSPALGRLIGPQDEPGINESLVAVLSYDYWQSNFGGDRGVLGDTLTVNDQLLTIVGVAPEGFSGALTNSRPQVFVPITLRSLMQPEEDVNGMENRLYNWIYLFARLDTDVPPELARERINLLYRNVVAERDAPLVRQFINDAELDEYLAHGLGLHPAARGQGAEQLTASNPLLLLLGATILVLLIVCVNITGLLLARGAARAGELAIRASIGASRTRLIGQLLCESTVFAVAGGLLALPIALVTLRILSALVPPELSNRFAVTLDTQALMVAAAASMTAVLLFGLLPALRASDTDPGRVIKGQAGQPSGSRVRARFRSVLIGAQISLSTVLLVLAGLFSLSLISVSRVDLGVDLESTLMFAVQPRAHGYEGARLDALYKRIRESLQSQPGVVSVGSSAIPLFAGLGFFGQVEAISGQRFEGEQGAVQSHPWTGPDYFATMGIPVLAGREFNDADSDPGAAVAIVNQEFLNRFNLGTDIVGQRIDLLPPYYRGGSIEIIGVTGNARHTAVKGDLPAQIFTPRADGNGDFSSFVFYVRGSTDPDSLLASIRPAIAAIDPNLPVSQLQMMTQRVRSSIYSDRLIAMLSAIFAGLATVLAAVGLYAVLSYNVGERTRELGLRLALGASPAGLLALVMKQVVWITVVAVTLGLVAALGVGQLAEALLFGVSGYDPVAFSVAVVVIAAVASGASFLPAHRASRVAPMDALRDQ